jgi:hypothetical protein
MSKQNSSLPFQKLQVPPNKDLSSSYNICCANLQQINAAVHILKAILRESIQAFIEVGPAV